MLFHVLLVLLGLVKNGKRELLICFEHLLVGLRLFLLRYDCHIGVELRVREAFGTMKVVLGEISIGVAQGRFRAQVPP